MRFKFQSKKLQLLYTEEKNARKYPANVVDNFFEVMAILGAIPNEQDLDRCKRMKYEKLHSERGEQKKYGIWLEQQWRLIITLDTDADGKFILVINVENLYRKAREKEQGDDRPSYPRENCPAG
jgi:toxin HigB-1